MISQMKKYTFLVFHRDYEPFLTQLRDLGVVHITQKAAGLIENDESLQAALQHEDDLRKLLKQGATDELLQERASIVERISAAQEAAQQASVWGEFDPAHIQALKEAGYTLRFFSCSIKSFQEEFKLVGLSLYNFVPSCQICNQKLKGTRVLGTGGVPKEKLSPSSPQFDGEKKTGFHILPKASVNAGRLRPTLNPQDYDLKLDAIDPDYEDYEYEY